MTHERSNAYIVDMIFQRFIRPVHVPLKRDKVDLKKKGHRDFFFISFISLQSTDQVDMKNVVECYKEFFAYFNTLETYDAI